MTRVAESRLSDTPRGDMPARLLMAAYGSTPSISSLEQGRRLSTPSLGACLPVGMPVSTIQSDLGSLTAGPFSLLVRDTAPGQESALPYGSAMRAGVAARPVPLVDGTGCKYG